MTRLTAWSTSTAVPRFLYGVGIWGDALRRDRTRRGLLSLQRHCCIGVGGCKFSVSHPVAQLLAGEPPLDLVASEHIVTQCLRNNVEPVKHIETEYRTEDLARYGMKALKIRLRTDTKTEWARRWRDDQRGRHTRKFFPTLESPLSIRLKLTRQSTEVLTGHGFFAEYQERILHVGEGKCLICNVTDDPSHRIFECDRFARQRDILRNSCTQSGLPWPASLEQIAQSRALEQIYLFARYDEQDQG